MVYHIFYRVLCVSDPLNKILIFKKEYTYAVAQCHVAQKILISFHLMMAVLNFSHEIDPHLTLSH